MTLLVAWLATPDFAHARGPRKVPDLRRDAAAWVQSPDRGVLHLPLTLHLAVKDGSVVADRELVRAWVTRANAELIAYGIQVEVVAVKRLPPGWTSVTRRQRRRGLASYAPKDGTIHVFGIGALDNGRRARRIRGLHWRYRGLHRELRGREYVVVTRSAPDTTLAHELGHLFGLGHAKAVNNIMCSCRKGANLGFTAAQGFAMRNGALRFLARQPGVSHLSAGRRDAVFRRR